MYLVCLIDFRGKNNPVFVKQHRSTVLYCYNNMENLKWTIWQSEIIGEILVYSVDETPKVLFASMFK